MEFVYYMGGGEARSVNNILELIGNTPMVRFNNVVDPGMANIYAKLESYNPGGSVKDRICLSMIEDAEKRGLLKPGSTVIEPTSGNTGIGLAMVCSIKGYKCILTLPEAMSLERVYILRSYGAEVVLTSAVEGMAGAIACRTRLPSRTLRRSRQQLLIGMRCSQSPAHLRAGL